MRNEVLQFLKNLPVNDSDKFNKAFELLRKSNGASFNQTRVYNAQGANAQNIKNIIYDLKKLHNISDAEVLSKKTANKVHEEIANKVTKTANAIVVAVTGNNESEKKTDLHKEFPFLSAKDCPAELHIVTGQLVASWKRHNALHAELQLVTSGEKELSEEDLFKLTAETNAAFELNSKLYLELEHYRDNKTVLGAVDCLKEYAVSKEINAMSVADLVKEQKNAASYLSKAKKDLQKDEIPEDKKEIIKGKIAEREFRLSLVNAKLNQA